MRALPLPASLVILTLAVSPTRSACAQVRVEIGPMVGLYLPTGSFRAAPYYSTALPSDPSDMTGLAWGAQGRLWVTRRVGLQLQIASASSSVGGGTTPVGVLAPTPVRVMTGTAQVLFDLHPAGATRLWVSSGVGLVRHGGLAYLRYGSPTQATGVLGLGSSIPLHRHLKVSLGLTTLLYSFTLRDSAAAAVERGFQVDALAHLGLVWALH